MLNPDFHDILCALHAEHAEFLIVGSYAMSAYTRPRATEDIDIWVRPSVENAERVMRALIRFGAPTAKWTVQDFSTENMVFQMGAPPWRIDLLTAIDGVTFDEAWAERGEFVVDGVKLAVLSRRHLLHNKRTVGRAKDLADVERLERHPSE